MGDYTLAISEDELARYRLMAQAAHTEEADAWAAAGIVPGATVGDVGCGPAAVTVAMAELVGDRGRVIGVERDADALDVARQVVAGADALNVWLSRGEAAATGIRPGSLDVAVMRHVLAHNGGREQALVDHLASLVRPGGSVYIVDVDITAIRMLDADPQLDDLTDTYARFHRQRGNDPQVGLRLGKLATRAGLKSVDHRGWFSIIPINPGVRPPAWAARHAMINDGIIDQDDLARWDAAFTRTGNATVRPTLFAALFSVTGRRSDPRQTRTGP